MQETKNIDKNNRKNGDKLNGQIDTDADRSRKSLPDHHKSEPIVQSTMSPAPQPNVMQSSLVSHYPIKPCSQPAIYPHPAQVIPQAPITPMNTAQITAAAPEIYKHMAQVWKELEESKIKNRNTSGDSRPKNKKNPSDETKKAQSVTKNDESYEVKYYGEGARDEIKQDEGSTRRPPNRVRYCRLCNEKGHQVSRCERYQPERREARMEDYEIHEKGYCVLCQVKGHYATSCPVFKWVPKTLPKGVFPSVNQNNETHNDK